MYISTYAYIHCVYKLHVHAHTHIHTHKHTYIQRTRTGHTRMPTCRCSPCTKVQYVYMYMHTHTYTRTNIHTHTHNAHTQGTLEYQRAVARRSQKYTSLQTPALSLTPRDAAKATFGSHLSERVAFQAGQVLKEQIKLHNKATFLDSNLRMFGSVDVLVQVYVQVVCACVYICIHGCL